MRKFTQKASAFLDAWLSFFSGVLLFVLSIVIAVFFSAFVYKAGEAVWTGDYSFFMRSEKHGEINRVGIESAAIASNLSSSIRSYLEHARSFEQEVARLSAEEPGSDRVGVLESRVVNLEEMVKLKPEEVASIATIAQRLASLEGDLQQAQFQTQAQIDNLNAWMLGLFGTLMVTVLGAAILSSFNRRKVRE